MRDVARALATNTISLDQLCITKSKEKTAKKISGKESERGYVRGSICWNGIESEAFAGAHHLDDFHGVSALPWFLSVHKFPQNHCVAEHVGLFL
jgi:hypothetical protein